MSGSERRTVRVRRSPRIGVFLAIGAVVGALAAVVLVRVTPVDPLVPTAQATGFVVLLLAPVGALLAGVVALLVDRRSERLARELEAERLPASAPEQPRD